MIEFLKTVLDETMETFTDSSVIHIGGDEVPKKRWRACGDCQSRIESEGLADEHELQAWLTNVMIDHVTSKGRTAMGWNEIIHEKLDQRAIVQYWLRNKKKTIEYIEKGGNVVVSHFFHVYLDYNYGVIPLKKTYNYEPVPRGLDPKNETNVLGIEAPMWSEFAVDEANLHAFIFPRLIAVAETGWSSKENRNFTGFTARLPRVLSLLSKWGIESTTPGKSQPGFFKRLHLLPRFVKQSSELP